AGDTGLTKRIMDESPFYPIYINWESSIQRSYLDHLLYIRQGQAYRGWDVRGVWLSPFYLAADAGRAITHAPVTWTVQVKNFAGDLRAVNGIVSSNAKRAQAALFPGQPSTTDACAPGAKPLTSDAGPWIEYGSDCRPRWQRVVNLGVQIATTIGVLPYDRNAGRIGHNSVGRMSLKLPSHLLWPRVKMFSPWAVRHIAWLPLRPISSVLIDMAGHPAYADMHRRTQAMIRVGNDIAQGDNPQPLAYRPASGAVAQLMDSLQALVAPTTTA